MLLLCAFVEVGSTGHLDRFWHISVRSCHRLKRNKYGLIGEGVCEGLLGENCSSNFFGSHFSREKMQSVTLWDEA